MIEVDISDEQRGRAEELYRFGALRNSITKGKSNIYGAVGEVVVLDFYRELGRSVILANDYDYDLLLNGHTVDVKTKRTTVKPKEHYLCSIAAANTKQECEYYYFVRVMEDLSKAWLLGYISKSGFFECAKFGKKGEDDGSGRFKFKADCYNLPILGLTTV